MHKPNRISIKLRKFLPNKKDKKFYHLVVAVFILSVFTGVTLSLVLRFWYAANLEAIKEIQRKEEGRRLERLLDKVSLR